MFDETVQRGWRRVRWEEEGTVGEVYSVLCTVREVGDLGDLEVRQGEVVLKVVCKVLTTLDVRRVVAQHGPRECH
jgi:hypothetical protein